MVRATSRLAAQLPRSFRGAAIEALLAADSLAAVGVVAGRGDAGS